MVNRGESEGSGGEEDRGGAGMEEMGEELSKKAREQL